MFHWFRRLFGRAPVVPSDPEMTPPIIQPVNALPPAPPASAADQFSHSFVLGMATGSPLVGLSITGAMLGAMVGDAADDEDDEDGNECVIEPEGDIASEPPASAPDCGGFE